MEEQINNHSRIATLEEVIFGNSKTGEKGMKQKVDEIHDIITQSKGVISFFGGLKGILGFIIVLGAVITIVKGWLIK